MVSNAEEAAASTVPGSDSKSPTNANVAPPKRRVAPTKSQSAKKPAPAKGRGMSRQRGKRAKPAGSLRAGSKTAKLVGLLKRTGGATLKELIKASGWQPHSVRGFLSGTVGKRMGMSVTSSRGEGGDRRYSVER